MIQKKKMDKTLHLAKRPVPGFGKGIMRLAREKDYPPFAALLEKFEAIHKKKPRSRQEVYSALGLTEEGARQMEFELISHMTHDGIPKELIKSIVEHNFSGKWHRGMRGKTTATER